MKTVTVSVSSDVYQRARARAVEQRISPAALVGGFVEQLAGDDPDFAGFRCEQNELIARIRAQYLAFSRADEMLRPLIHERDSLR